MHPPDRITQRLAILGVPRELLDQSQPGLVAFVRGNRPLIPEIVNAILPTDAEVSSVPTRRAPRPPTPRRVSETGSDRGTMEELFRESMLWMQWLMFEGDPHATLNDLAEKAAGRRALCGVVLRERDLAYHCRTCEQDSTCVICMACFQDSDHEGHDYSVSYSSGGCCDCGDETAWKRDGFCSKHTGAGEVRPLPDDLADHVGPILDSLFKCCWKGRLLSAEQQRRTRRRESGDAFANGFSSSVVEMLLNFCNCSESLLSFTCQRMMNCDHLLEILLRAETFLDQKVTKKLHELLLKLLRDSSFKYELAKVFVRYYPSIVSQAIKECSDSTFKKYPTILHFPVQLFTVPTLTARLVQEENLLSMLMGCLRDLFLSCAAANGHLQVSKWSNVYETTIHMLAHIRYVMNLKEVLKYIAEELPDFSRSWIWLISLVQGMDSQKRATALPLYEENKNLAAPFVLAQCLGNVNNLLVDAAFSVAETRELIVATLCCSNIQDSDDADGQRHTKVGRVSQESSACTSSKQHALDYVSKSSVVNSCDTGSGFSVPSSVIWLILQCLKAIESSLRMDSSSFDSSSSRNINIMTLRKKLYIIKKGTDSNKVHRTSIFTMDVDGLQEAADAEGHEMFNCSTHGMTGSNMTPPYQENACTHNAADGFEELDSAIEFSVLNLDDWPDMAYDVSSEEISIHIPLHRFLSLLLRKAMRTCYTETGKLEKEDDIPLSVLDQDFFGKLLGGLQPCRVSAFVMEHPLRLRVFCAQVRGDMWRRNGDTAILLSEGYHAARWLEQGLESDLFLLQCCAALSPAELFVKRIQERFGLSSYTHFSLTHNNEYESVLVQEMLTLLIQVVQERRFCGFSLSENLRRELVRKLAIGDATHSQLVDTLPQDLSKSDQFQSVLNMVAEYSNPYGLKQGIYSLRKTQWKELDLYHPRWNSKDFEVAQERYLRFCKVSALHFQLPRWTNIFEPLKKISRVATSKASLQIVRAVLFYALFTKNSSMSRAPDGVLITALHLLSLALDVCENEGRINIDKVGADFGMAHVDGRSGLDTSTTEDLLPPVLECANEKFDTGAANGSVLWKNQSMLSLLVSLMRKYKGQSHSNYADARQFDISSFIENLLKKFAQLSSSCLFDLKCLAPDVFCQLPHPATSQHTPSASDIDDRRPKARERQAAILAKMRAEQSKFIASVKYEDDDDTGFSKSKEEVCCQEFNSITEESKPTCSLCRDPNSRSPLCFLILLQKSCLTSFMEQGPPSWEGTGLKNKEILSVRNDGLNDPSGADSSIPLQFAQNSGLELTYDIEPAEFDAFLKSSDNRLADMENIQLPNLFYDTNSNTAFSFGKVENDIYQFVKGEIHATATDIDILDDEQRCPTSHIPTESSLLEEYVPSLLRGTSREHQHTIHDLHISNISSRSISSTPTDKYNRFGPRDCDGIHLSSCGHAVHQECHDRYLLSPKGRNRRRASFGPGSILDPDMGEFLCPICRRLANSIMPALPGISARPWSEQNIPLAGSTPSTSSDKTNNILHLPIALSLLQSTSKMVGHSRFLTFFSRMTTETIDPALEPVLHKVSTLYYPRNHESLLASGRLSQSLILWDTLRYTLASTEIASRDKLEANAAGCMSCMEALYGELNSSGSFILSLLLHVAQTVRSLHCLEVLRRFRGIQLSAESICSGVSGDISVDSEKHRGTLTSSLENADMAEAFPDIQFWKRAADPILAHDPFSSLLWVLYCLPLPFMSSTEFLIPFIHLFYAVCVVQATITCYSNQYFRISNFGNSLLNDVCKTVGESEIARKYFASNYVDSGPPCELKDMIRRLSFPYLRKCALLWRLLQLSPLTPLFDCSNTLDRTNHSMNIDAIDSNDRLAVELSQVKELEDMFKIHSLDLVFKDKRVHSLALKWCEHFCSEFGARSSGSILFSSLASPFKLMQLPLVYQDLLQRYIKQPCSSCNSVPVEPTLCLLCGKLCSPSRRFCCRESKCRDHAMMCGAGVGVFLMVKRTTILLQRSLRQSIWPSPYLDAYGEEDIDLLRGKPLYLSKERYATLTYLMASHGFDRSSEVLRQTFITHDGSD